MKSTLIISGALVVASPIHATLAGSHVRAHGASHVVVRAALQSPSDVPIPNQYKSQGCFSSKGNMTSPAKPIKGNLSSGVCNNECKAENYFVSGLQGNSCFCGFAMPPTDSVVKDSFCDYACPAYGHEACGAIGQPGFFSVWNTGININPPVFEPLETSTTATTTAPTSSTKSTEPTLSHTAAATETQETTSTSPPEKKKSSGANVAAVAAGSIAGVVVISGLIGAALFMMKRKRNAEIEEEHRRNAAVNAFINGSKPSSTSGSISMTDSRLDPVMAHRRLSDGSIADNEDYSRRILRVTNA